MNHLAKKSFFRGILIALAIGICVFSIVSLDTSHVDLCEHHHCFLCSTIVFSQKLVMAVMYTFTTLLTVTLWAIAVLRKDCEEKGRGITILHTLLFQKTQWNE